MADKVVSNCMLKDAKNLFPYEEQKIVIPNDVPARTQKELDELWEARRKSKT